MRQIYSRVNIVRVYYFAHAKANTQFTPGFDQTQKYIKFYSRKYFKVSRHANAN